MKFCLDANALITSWLKFYCQEVFPSLWDALAQNREELILIKPIFDEIEPTSSEDRKKRLAIHPIVN